MGTSLLRLAKPTGFRALLFDDRAEDQIPEAVSLADRFVRVENVERDILNTSIPTGAFFVLCGHDHAVDGEALAAALQKIAPLYRHARQPPEDPVAVCQAQRTRRDAKELDFVHAPIGLDLGGETPQELAVGILAELLLVKNGRTAASGFKPHTKTRRSVLLRRAVFITP